MICPLSVFTYPQSQHKFQMYKTFLFHSVHPRATKTIQREIERNEVKKVLTTTLDSAKLLVKPTMNEALNYLTLLLQIVI